MRLFVQNLSYRTNYADLEELFSKHGKVLESYFPHRRDGRCYAYVVMESEADAQRAIKALNGKPFNGLAMRVQVARPRRDGRR